MMMWRGRTNLLDVIKFWDWVAFLVFYEIETGNSAIVADCLNYTYKLNHASILGHVPAETSCRMS